MTKSIGQEKQRISGRLAGLDAEWEKLSALLNELEIAEHVLARFGGKVVTTEKRQKARPVKTRRRLVKGAEREEANRRAACR